MLVRMLVGLAGAPSLKPGDEHDFPQDEALRFIVAGFAVPVAEVKIERAVRPQSPERRGKRAKNVASSDNNDNGDV